MGPTCYLLVIFILKFLFRKDLQKPHNLEDLLSQDEKVLIKNRSVLKSPA
jgi:hypothetical protein